MRITKINHEVIVPAGAYWLGDPCYAVPNELWDELLASNGCFECPVGTVKKHKVLGFGTAYGDGVYTDQFGNEYPVDAGLIGLTPVGLTVGEPFGSHKVVFKHDTLCTGDDGVMRFGDIKINTRDFDGYDDEEDDDES